MIGSLSNILRRSVHQLERDELFNPALSSFLSVSLVRISIRVSYGRYLLILLKELSLIGLFVDLMCGPIRLSSGFTSLSLYRHERIRADEKHLFTVISGPLFGYVPVH